MMIPTRKAGLSLYISRAVSVVNHNLGHPRINYTILYLGTLPWTGQHNLPCFLIATPYASRYYLYMYQNNKSLCRRTLTLAAFGRVSGHTRFI